MVMIYFEKKKKKKRQRLKQSLKTINNKWGIAFLLNFLYVMMNTKKLVLFCFFVQGLNVC